MRRIRFNRPDKFYISLLLTITALITLTIFILSAILYINFKNTALANSHSSLKDNLTQVSYSATFMSDSAESMALQMYFDADLSKLLHYSSVDINQLLVSMKKLDSYRNTTPFIHSIYIYNGKTNKFYTTLLNMESVDSTAFFDKEIIQILNNFETYKSKTVIPRRILDPYKKYEQDQLTNVYTVVFNESSENNILSNEAVILNISEKWLRDIIDSLGANPESNTFIIDGVGNTMISSQMHPILKNLAQEKYINKIVSSTSPSGYFISEVEGNKSLITYVTYPSLDWIFIRTTPYENIINDITGMKLITLLSTLLILIIGLLLSFIVSRKLYKPIHRMTDKLKSFETEKRENLYSQKQSLLQNILLGNTEPNPLMLSASFAKFDIKLNTSDPLMILLLKIDCFSDFCNNYTLHDRNLFKFGIMNIASELCSKHYCNEPVDAGEDHVALLLNISEMNEVYVSGVIEELARDIQSSVMGYLHISLSITISSVEKDMMSMSWLYRECLESSLYRVFYGHQSIIHTHKIKKLPPGEYAYPTQKEKYLIEALMLGKAEDVKHIYFEIISNADRYPYTDFQSTLFHLARAINTALERLPPKKYSALPYNYTAFIAEIGKLETLDEINKLFTETFDHILFELEIGKSTKHDKLIETITDIIHKSYSDSNLSIETIAQAVNMSPVYLGRLFKKLTAKSVSDYISDIRIEKSKQLMIETNLSINEILEKTGFVSAGYFYTLFKKLHGMTPNEFRKKK